MPGPAVLPGRPTYSLRKRERHQTPLLRPATMTTAHRPTWKAAVGRAQEGGWGAGGAISTATSALDAPAHTKLKTRSGAQVVDRRAALAESLRKLEEAEKKSGADAIRRGIVGRRAIDPEDQEASRRKLLEHDKSRDVDEER